MELLTELMPVIKGLGGVGGWILALYMLYTMKVKRNKISAESSKLSAEADLVASSGFRELVRALKDEIKRLGEKIEALQVRLDEALKEIGLLTESLLAARKKVMDLEDDKTPEPA